jgi:hypothetical protein
MIILNVLKYSTRHVTGKLKKPGTVKRHHQAYTGVHALTHLETGGPNGAVILLSLQTDNGVLFEAFDPQFNKLFDFSIADMVERWESR